MLYCVSWALSSMNPVMPGQLQRKLVPDLEEDNLQGFPNEDIRKSEIFDSMCATRIF